MSSKNKKLIIFMLIMGILLITVGGVLNYFSSSKRIVLTSIDKLSTNLKNIIGDDEAIVGDNYTLNSNIKFDLKSDYLTSLSTTDSNYLPYVKLLNNLNNTDTNINIVQDKTNKKLLLNYNSMLNTNELISGKYLIEDNTEYYYVSGITSSYINNGNSNYFESLNESVTQKENLLYLYDVVIESLKNNIKDEYIVRTNEDDLLKVSLKLNNKNIKELSKNILKDLKDDKKATLILTGYNKDFEDFKITDDFFNKDEELEFNIYTDRILYSLKKCELVFRNSDNLSKIVYESKDDNKKIINIYNNEKKEMSFEVLVKDENTVINIYDSTSEQLGNIEISKTKNNKKILMEVSINNVDINFSMTSKNSNVKSNISYDNNTDIEFNVTSDKNNLASFKILLKSSITNNTKIEEDLSNSILASSVTEDEKNKLNNKITTVITNLMN